MPKCIVDGCPNKQRRMRCTANFSLHGFPRYPELIKLWLLSTGQDFGDIDKFVQCIRDTKKDNKYRMCSAHFTPQSYYTQGVRKYLKPDAVPTIFVKTKAPASTGRAVRPKPIRSGLPAISSVGILLSNRIVNTQEQNFTSQQELSIDHNYASDVLTYKFRTTAELLGTSMDKKTTIERILTHVLEIIYLLTGEHLNIPLMTNKMHQDLKPMNKLIMNYAMEIIYLLIGQKDTFVMNSPHSHHLTGEVPLQPAGVAVSYPVMEKSKLLEGPQEIVVESHQIRSSGGDIADVVSNAQQTADLCVRSLLEAPEQDICGISSGLNDEIIYTVSIKEEGEDETQEKDTEQVEIQQDLGAGLHDEYLHTASTKEESGENKEEKDTEQVQIHTETSAGLCTVKEEEEERDISPVEIHPNLGAGSNDEKPYHVSIKEELEEEIKKDRNHDKELGTGLTEPSDDNLYSASIKEEAEEETEEINIQQVDIRPDLGAGLHNDNRNPVLINVEGEYERDRKAIWPVDINSVISKVLSSKVDGPKSRDLLKESYPAVPAPVAMGAHTSMFQVTTPGPSTSCVNELTRNKASTSQQTSVQRKRHRCNECGKMFDYKSLLNRHQIIHSVEKPYKCNECGKRYAYKHVLVTHQKMHTGDLPYSCNECRKNFAKKSHLRAHAISHREDRNFRCSECGKEFACERYLIIHQRIHTYVKSYRCNACGKLFACRRYLTIHKKSHATELPHKCDVCGKRFVYNYHLIKHQRSHTGEKPYMCSQCGKHFIDKYNLAAHHKTHMGVKPYRCNECGTDYATKSSLTRHKKSHTGETQEL